MYKIDTSSFETASDFDSGMAALWRNIPAKLDVLGLNFGPKDFDSRRDHFQALDNLADTYKSRKEEILQYKALMEAWEDATDHLI